MDELWVRLILLGGAIASALLVGWYLPRRNNQPVRRLRNVSLEPGVHFFSSSTCDACAGAREQLVGALGRDGFTEHEWATGSVLFASLGIDAVPATLVVADDGRGMLVSGDVAPALAAL